VEGEGAAEGGAVPGGGGEVAEAVAAGLGAEGAREAEGAEGEGVGAAIAGSEDKDAVSPFLQGEGDIPGEELVTTEHVRREKVGQEMNEQGSNLRRQKARKALVVGLWALLVGCGPSLPPAPIEPTMDPGFEAGAPAEKPGLIEDEEEGPEPLYPGDVVAIQMIGGQEQESRPTPVDRGGYVHVALLGSVKVAGLPLHEAEARLQKALARVDRFSQVSLALVEARGRHASVVGAVERPGHVVLQGDMRLADVLAEAGGPRSAAQEDRLAALGDLDGLRLVRKGQVLPVDGRRALEGDPRHNVRVRPGDIVHVPPALAARVMVLGEVGRPRSMGFRPGMRLTEALADAGGLARSADNADVRVIRGGYASPRVYVASPKALFAGKAPDVLLAPGDVIFVTEHWMSTVGQVLERVIPATTTAVLLGTTMR
jgi:polysaccharide export outer membrane protein